jgi:hypothetical protein
VPKRERDLEMTKATPGMTTLASAATLLSSLLTPAELTAALSTGPARALGIDPPAPISTSTTAKETAAPADDLYRLAHEVRL